MDTDNIYAYWDEVIDTWRENKEIHPSQKFWFEKQHHIKLYPDQLPEPYWGDIDCNSVVFINFNPGGKHNQCKWDKKTDTNTICGHLSYNYSEKVKTFALLDEDDFYKQKGKDGVSDYEGSKWWKKRIKWLEHFNINTETKPFAIELCAWHSKKWKRAKYECPELEKYITDVFGIWIRRAIKNSETKLALCIGKEFIENVFPLIWPNNGDFENVTAKIFDSSLMDNGYMKIGDNNRKFGVFKVPEGHIVCTFTQGSNGMPSSKIFRDYESKIYEEIKINK